MPEYSFSLICILAISEIQISENRYLRIFYAVYKMPNFYILV